MILLILSILVFIALIAINFLKIQKKLAILCGAVCILILFNFINQIQAYRQSTVKAIHIHEDSVKQQIRILTEQLWQFHENNTQQLILNQLIQEEKQIGNLIFKNWQDEEYSMFYFKNLHPHRLRIILDYFKMQVNNSNHQNIKNLKLYHINYKTQQCNLNCLLATFTKDHSQHFNILVAEGVQKTQDFNNIEQLYFKINLTIIFEDLTQSFTFHSISRIVTKHQFSNNYLSKLLEHQPQKIISHCSLYHDFDYYFYAASQNYPLNQLCSRILPSTLATRCLQKLIKQEKDGVPLSWARECLREDSKEGIIQENGWVYLDKQYFWNGKVNRTEIRFNQTFDL